MGNRAVITSINNLKIKEDGTKELIDEGIGIYLHWNGGRDSIEAFLAYCDMKRYRKPEQDSYGYAMLVNVITNWFGNGLSCDVNTLNRLDCDNYDNGVYVIKDWRVVDRVYSRGEQYEYDFKEMLQLIDESQPEDMRLTDEEKAHIPEVYEDVMKYRKKA